MRENILYPDEPTLDEERSKAAISNILTRKDWRGFSSVQNPRLDYWIERYITLHAKVPSMFSSTNTVVLVPAMFPLETFKVVSPVGIIYDGGGYSNGALIRIRTKNLNMKILCVDEEIVKLFKYDLVSATADVQLNLSDKE